MVTGKLAYNRALCVHCAHAVQKHPPKKSGCFGNHRTKFVRSSVPQMLSALPPAPTLSSPSELNHLEEMVRAMVGGEKWGLAQHTPGNETGCSYCFASTILRDKVISKRDCRLAG